MLKQTASVQEYQVEFDKLSHGVLLYNPAFDETFFVTRFMAGLRDEIRSAILLHRPSDVDTASALAMIQEQELEQSRTKSSRRDFTRGAARAVPGPDKYKQPETVKPAVKGKEDTDDKLAMLKAFRRRNGLCFKCGEKWGPAHKCPTHVSLHVLEELLDAMDIMASAEDEQTDVEIPDEEQAVLTVQTEPAGNRVNKQTLKLLATIGKQSVLILVDSGSIGTFVSDNLVSQLKLPTVQCAATAFRAADGSQMICNKKIPNLKWFIQGHTFISDAKVLPLRCYDLILGEDWLEEYSPIWVDYKSKKMSLTVNGHNVPLQGVVEDMATCLPISQAKLSGLLRRGAVSHCIQMYVPDLSLDIPSICTVDLDDSPSPLPESITSLLHQYGHLFDEPKSLPPRRSADHKIPFFPGAQPVKVRPYRYSPVQKTEIEAQLKQMLEQGVIRPGDSSFASPVLLVRKKDGSWRFCVDYRHLNAITVKNKHPMPVVDELLDELAGAKWFTKLDFRSGYHQICMAAGAVLMQDSHPVAYLNKPLGPRNQALSVYEKECLAILLAIEKWRSYLQHQHFIIKTDHKRLQYLTDQRVSTRLQLKALLKLMDLQYTIQYKTGTSNRAADALSRYD